MLNCVSKPLALSPWLWCDPCMALMGSSVCQVPAWLCDFTVYFSEHCYCQNFQEEGRWLW